MSRTLYISLWILLAAPLWADLDAVNNSARADLDAALDELSELRQQIRTERIPLARQRSDLHEEVRSLRQRAADARTAAQRAGVDLRSIEEEMDRRRDENDYVRNLLEEYTRTLQSRIHESEVAGFGEELLAILDEAEQADELGEHAKIILAQGVGLGLERAGNLIGGRTFSGGAVLPGGEFGDGTFVLIGPLAYFAAESERNGVNAGMVFRSAGSLRPTVEAVGRHSPREGILALSRGESGILPLDPTMGNARAMAQTQPTLWEHIQQGGIWIIPILTFALLATIVALFKAIELYSIPMPREAAIREILDHLQAGDHDKARRTAADLPGPGGDMIREGVRHSGESVELVEQICMERVLEAQPRTQRFLTFIATTAAVSPLLGLLGTVTGMINTFQLITVFGTGDARNLSSGISEALVTTEFGLIVAIPALIMHALLSRKANSILAGLERQAISFTNGLRAGLVQEAA